MRGCSKSGCAERAEVTVALVYGERAVVMVDLMGERDPNLLELCGSHAARLSPPVGWNLEDRRSAPERSG